jgi:hypothetical protein
MADVLLVLGLPLLLLVGLTLWLQERNGRLPAPLAGLAAQRTRLWVSFLLLWVAVMVGRLLLARR